MYDFQSVLDQANEAFQIKDYAKAAYYYWEINFAYENEEFPLYYTHKIRDDAQKGFERTMELISVDEILTSKFYRTLHRYYDRSPFTQKYILRFERDIVNYAL